MPIENATNGQVFFTPIENETKGWVRYKDRKRFWPQVKADAQNSAEVDATLNPLGSERTEQSENEQSIREIPRRNSRSIWARYEDDIREHKGGLLVLLAQLAADALDALVRELRADLKEMHMQFRQDVRTAVENTRKARLERNAFIAVRKIKRAARYTADRTYAYAVTVSMLCIEAFAGTELLAIGNPLGRLGAFIIAGIIAVFNCLVTFSLVDKIMSMRFENEADYSVKEQYPRKRKRYLWGVALYVFVVQILVTGYRAMVVGEARAADTEAGITLLGHVLVFDIYGVLLCGLGLFFALVASSAAWRLHDPIAGYDSVDKEFNAADAHLKQLGTRYGRELYERGEETHAEVLSVDALALKIHEKARPLMVALSTLVRDCLDEMNYLRTQTRDTLIIYYETKWRIDPTHKPAPLPEDLNHLFNLQETVDHYGIHDEESQKLADRVRTIQQEVPATQEKIRKMIEAAVEASEQIETDLTEPELSPSRDEAKPKTTTRR